MPGHANRLGFAVHESDLELCAIDLIVESHPLDDDLSHVAVHRVPSSSGGPPEAEPCPGPPIRRIPRSVLTALPDDAHYATTVPFEGACGTGHRFVLCAEREDGGGRERISGASAGTSSPPSHHSR